MFYVLIKVYDVENKLFLNKMSIFCTIYTFVLFIRLYFNLIWQMLIFFYVRQFFGFAYKNPILLSNSTKTYEFPIDVEIQFHFWNGNI